MKRLALFFLVVSSLMGVFGGASAQSEAALEAFWKQDLNTAKSALSRQDFLPDVPYQAKALFRATLVYTYKKKAWPKRMRSLGRYLNAKYFGEPWQINPAGPKPGAWIWRITSGGALYEIYYNGKLNRHQLKLTTAEPEKNEVPPRDPAPSIEPKKAKAVNLKDPGAKNNPISYSVPDLIDLKAMTNRGKVLEQWLAIWSHNEQEPGLIGWQHLGVEGGLYKGKEVRICTTIQEKINFDHTYIVFRNEQSICTPTGDILMHRTRRETPTGLLTRLGVWDNGVWTVTDPENPGFGKKTFTMKQPPTLFERVMVLLQNLPADEVLPVRIFDFDEMSTTKGVIRRAKPETLRDSWGRTIPSAVFALNRKDPSKIYVQGKTRLVQHVYEQRNYFYTDTKEESSELKHELSLNPKYVENYVNKARGFWKSKGGAWENQDLGLKLPGLTKGFKAAELSDEIAGLTLSLVHGKSKARVDVLADPGARGADVEILGGDLKREVVREEENLVSKVEAAKNTLGGKPAYKLNYSVQGENDTEAVTVYVLKIEDAAVYVVCRVPESASASVSGAIEKAAAGLSFIK